MHGQQVFGVFDLLWQTPSSRAHNVILSYVTKRLIPFVPFKNFKVHVIIGIAVPAIPVVNCE